MGFQRLERFAESVAVLAAGLGESWLASASAFDGSGGFADHLGCVHPLVHKIIGEHYSQQGLAGHVDRGCYEGCLLRTLLSDAEGDGLDNFGNTDLQDAVR